MSAAVCEPLLQVAELKSKLDSAERFLGTLEKERLQSPRESCPPHCRTSEPLRRAEVGGARERIPAPRRTGPLPPTGQGVQVSQGPKPGARSLESEGFASSFAVQQASSAGRTKPQIWGCFSRVLQPRKKFILLFCFYSY